jgi:hypothetical protein
VDVDLLQAEQFAPDFRQELLDRRLWGHRAVIGDPCARVRCRQGPSRT